MCPDPQLISVYFDGELPSPWKEKMESHLAQCPGCRRRLEGYGLLSGGEQEKAAVAEVSARERVWKKFAEKTGMTVPDSGNISTVSPGHYNHPYPIRHGFWGRRVSIPLPAAAAVALLIIAAALWTLQTRGQRTLPNMTVASEEFSLWPPGMDVGFESPGMYPAADLNGVLQYLGARDSGDIVILRLPETRSFMSSGEPAIIRAADYSRRKP
jgi:hypothetical protein